MKREKLKYGEVYENGNEECFYLEDMVALGEFISEMKPNLNLNKIPLQKWFIYQIDESGDNRLEDLIDLNKHIETEITDLLSLAKRISRLKEIQNS